MFLGSDMFRQGNYRFQLLLSWSTWEGGEGRTGAVGRPNLPSGVSHGIS